MIGYPAIDELEVEIRAGQGEHPDVFTDVDPASKLRVWGQQLGANEDLGERFEQASDSLEQGDLADWEKQVSGKYVLRLLHQRFPRLPGAGQFPLDHYLNEYLRACPDPPADLVELIERIIEDAGRRKLLP